ncbi:TIGR04282 family arsenosugar biosynthesis glycosyltransferase [Sedimenticola sp.]|uniref:TIGR04282 family arsenosugar biosynthesis glycosyltransferase n=1 Tax=Sedimenticola sp. TaxID=1940285 RepID=UPI003D1071C1
MRFPKSRILLFAKAPRAGQVKTRLVPSIGEEGAASIYRTLLERVIEQAAGQLAPLEIWCAPDTQHAVFRQAATRPNVTLHRQVDGDLGQRMAFATRQALAHSEAILLIGGDCPVLDAGHLFTALTWLDGGADAVIGPAEDGGYVLLGLRRLHSTLFSDIPWGTSDVLAITRQRLDQLGWSWRELEVLWDLDRETDLERYRCLERSSR